MMVGTPRAAVGLLSVLGQYVWPNLPHALLRASI